jgi:hypothetical protein
VPSPAIDVFCVGGKEGTGCEFVGVSSDAFEDHEAGRRNSDSTIYPLLAPDLRGGEETIYLL